MAKQILVGIEEQNLNEVAHYLVIYFPYNEEMCSYTDDWLGELYENKYPLVSKGMFVFGSNLQGHHTGGAARYAYKHFGAEWGVGIGPTGQCYAIPTMHGGVDDIRPYVEDFVKYAKSHPLNRFLLTRIGCGIAGFSDKL